MAESTEPSSSDPSSSSSANEDNSSSDDDTFEGDPAAAPAAMPEELVLTEKEEEAILGEIVEELPPHRRRQLVRIVKRLHSGPIPDPATLAAYEAALPGTGKEIIEGAREYRHHHMDMDNKLADTARLSLKLAFASVLSTLGLAGFAAYMDQPWLAGVFGAAGLTPVLVNMIRGGGRWSGK